MGFSGKRIVLTGGSGGLGRYVVTDLASAGAEVIVLSRHWDSSGMPAVRHVAVDLAGMDGIARAVSLVEQERPDILINMAGTQYFGPIEKQSLEAMHASYMINLVAPAALCRASVVSMKSCNSGQIVIVGSVFGAIPFAHFTTYSSAKGGLRAFSEALRRELADTDIAVTYVAPRAMRTAMLTSEMKRYADLTSMRVDAPERVATKVVGAIRQRKREVYIGLPEQFFVRLNAVLPRVVDAAVASTDRKAAAIFS